MSSNVKLLSLILVLQLGVSLWIYSGTDKLSTFVPNAKLVEFENKDLKKIILSNATTEEDRRVVKDIQLLKEGELWKVKIKDNFSFEADKEKVNSLISKIKNFKKPLPVATTKSSFSKLNLKEDNFEKKITLNTESRSKEILIGSQAGFKEVYIRNKDDNNSYSVSFDTYELEFDPLKWINTDILKLKFEDIKSLELKDLKLIKEENSFKLADDKELTLDQQKVTSLIKSIANLTINSVVVKDKTKMKAGVLSVRIKTDNKEVEYSLYENNETEYNLSASNMPYVFTVLKAPIDKMMEYTKEKLKAEDKPEADVVVKAEEDVKKVQKESN